MGLRGLEGNFVVVVVVVWIFESHEGTDCVKFDCSLLFCILPRHVVALYLSQYNVNK